MSDQKRQIIWKLSNGIIIHCRKAKITSAEQNRQNWCPNLVWVLFSVKSCSAHRKEQLLFRVLGLALNHFPTHGNTSPLTADSIVPAYGQGYKCFSFIWNRVSTTRTEQKKQRNREKPKCIKDHLLFYHNGLLTARPQNCTWSWLNGGFFIRFKFKPILPHTHFTHKFFFILFKSFLPPICQTGKVSLSQNPSKICEVKGEHNEKRCSLHNWPQNVAVAQTKPAAPK